MVGYIKNKKKQQINNLSTTCPKIDYSFIIPLTLLQFCSIIFCKRIVKLHLRNRVGSFLIKCNKLVLVMNFRFV